VVAYDVEGAGVQSEVVPVQRVEPGTVLGGVVVGNRPERAQDCVGEVSDVRRHRRALPPGATATQARIDEAVDRVR
jgi:hypothetical protein